MSPLALARHTTGPSTVLRENLTREYLAFTSLALTQRRLSWVARRRAWECEGREDLEGYRYFAKEAKRLWRDAAYHLWCAQNRKDRRDAA